LQNADGKFVTPGANSFKAAAAGAAWAKSFRQVLYNKPCADAWPITTATYILMHAKQDKPENARTVLKFFDWVYTHGDAAAAELDYVPMPAAVKTQIRERAFGAIQDGAGKAIAYQ